MGQVQLIVDERASLRERLVHEVARWATAADLAGARLRVAVAGGSVAQVFFPGLAQLQAAAQKQLDVFFCDERGVPLTHPDSNFRQAKELWLDAASLSSDQVHPLSFDGSLESGAHAYEALLRQRSENPLDIVLLGMGPDGHIASLFPGHPALKSQRWVEVVRDSPKPPAERLTMTLSLLLRARHVFLAAFGPEKAPVLARALAGDLTLPVARLLARAPLSTLYVDQELAAQLPAQFLSAGVVSVDSTG